MFSLFRRSSAPMLGLDLSASSVKVVEVSQAATGELVLHRCATERLERGAMRDGRVVNFEGVAQAVVRALRKSGSKLKRAAMALPDSVVTSRAMDVPDGLSESDLLWQVESDLQRYLPFSAEDARLDFYVIGPSARSPGNVSVQVVAAHKDMVDERVALAEAAGLLPVIMDVESMANRRAFKRATGVASDPFAPPLIGLLHMGAFRVVLQVFLGDELVYETEHLEGADRLTQMIEQRYQYDAAEADRRKHTGDLPEDYPEAVLHPFMAHISQDIGRLFEFFFSASEHHSLDHVYLSGGGALLPGVSQRTSEYAACECSVLDPFAGMAVKPGVSAQRLVTESPAYLTALGLALRLQDSHAY